MQEAPANLLTKILQSFNHYLVTAYSIATDKYGGHNDQLGGTGQGNVLSGAICKNVSCIIFKVLENDVLGVNLTSPVTERRVLRTLIAFVDDGDFFSCGQTVVEKLSKLVAKYNKLHRATAETGQLDKTTSIYGKRSLIVTDRCVFKIFLRSLRWKIR